MHCNICDKMLTEKEIVLNNEIETFEPCVVCLEVALEAAYQDGFNREDDEFILLDEEDIIFVRFDEEYADDEADDFYDKI